MSREARASLGLMFILKADNRTDAIRWVVIIGREFRNTFQHIKAKNYLGTQTARNPLLWLLQGTTKLN